MKHIVKGDEPRELAEWKALESEDWQPTYRDMPGEIKAALKQALMTEQGHICCYCECRLAENDSHIEHFKPQRDPTVDALDFSNMLCSCQNRLKKKEPKFCGNLKGGWFDAKLLISPLDPGCEKRFAFTGDGCIHAKDESIQAAGKTIEKLGLNRPKRNAMRAGAIDPFLDPDLSDEELALLVSGYLGPGEAGRYGAFWTTISYLFGEYVAKDK